MLSGARICTVSVSRYFFRFQSRLMDYVFSGLKIPEQLSNYALKCKSAPLGRPAPSRLLSVFSKHPLVKYFHESLPNDQIFELLRGEGY